MKATHRASSIAMTTLVLMSIAAASGIARRLLVGGTTCRSIWRVIRGR